MKSCWAIPVSIVLLASCARKEKPTTYSEVPGPSQTSVSLPAPPVVEPAPERKPPPAKSSEGKAESSIVTPDTSLTGKVVKFNPTARIVVLEFPIVKMPAAGRQMFIYRNELKVGEVKTTAWQKSEHIVADLINGEAQEGDIVRDR